MRRGAKPAKAKVEAKPSGARKSRKSEGSTVSDLEKRLAEALGQQAATAEILRVISTSPADVQPVFDSIVKSGTTLCDAAWGAVVGFDGQWMTLLAQHNMTPSELETLRGIYPRLPTRAFATGRALVDRRTVHIPDIREDPQYQSPFQQVLGFRAVLAVPMLRDGKPIGVLALWRREVRPFTDQQIALVEIFAAQAVIAIENVRLFNETKEALERQTATSEILRVISSSPTDLQPVFDTIATSSVQLCGATYCGVFIFDGRTISFVAHHGIEGVALDTLRRIWPRRAELDTTIGTVILQRGLLHVHDLTTDPRFTVAAAHAASVPIRTFVGVPMLRRGEPIGVIGIYRIEVAPFSDRQIELVKTFADQAVIAIENVRLFTETKEALEQQTATSDILRVISSSPTDLQPVFDVIVSNALRLCDGLFSTLFRFDGELITFVANASLRPEWSELVRSNYPTPPRRGHIVGQAILERRVVHLHDAANDPNVPPTPSQPALAYRSAIVVPMLREGVPVGAIGVGRGEVKPFTDKQISMIQTFADQAVIAIENVRLFTELQTSNRDLTTALDTQTATSDILRVISRSQTDVQPVFDAIVSSAVRLLRGYSGALIRVAGDRIELAALTSTGDVGVAAQRARFPQPLQSPGPHAETIRARAPINVVDAQTDPGWESEHAYARARGYRSVVAVPLLRHRQAIGAIAVTRRELGGFTDDEIALLQTFADQAVIAIENVRLFTELEARNRDLTTALDQRTATAEILRVISSSPTDVQPTFEAIAESATRLCGAVNGVVSRFDGELIHAAAHHNMGGVELDAILSVFPTRPGRGSVTGRAIESRRIVHVEDLTQDPEYEHARIVQAGFRTALSVPMLREGMPIGAINVMRMAVAPFTPGEIALLQTFADQAVIAIENVRLFKELEARNSELTEALEQQTATSEILRVISRSQTDVQPVFDAIIRSAVTLCDGLFGALYRFDGEMMHQVAQHNYGPDALAEARRAFPARPSRGLTGGRAILERRVVQLPDIELDPEYQQAIARAAGARSILAVPMLREGAATGAIAVGRAEPGPFSDTHVELLKTFADQALIAVENVRLFTELRDRTAQLGRSVDELTALGQVSQALSSTLELETVLTTIVQRAIELSGADGGSVYEYDDVAEEFRLRATRNFEEELVEAARTMPLRRGEGALGLVADQRRPVQFPDISDPDVYQSPVRETLLRTGYRAVLALPMLRDVRLVGALTIGRKSVGEFAPGVIDLLTTFANQATLAMQNARLFREIADKSRQLEAASQHKSEFLANMSHELRTPLNAIIGFSEVLTERMFGELNEKQDEYLKDIYASGTHLLSLINDILDLSKIEAGRMELELTDFHLSTALDSALTLVRERAGRRGIALQMNVDNRLGHIRADERKVRQVVLNLLSNAIKFTPEGGRIEVRATPQDGLVEVSVSDTGVGIAPEDQEAVFEEFRQVGTADKKIEGTGLGLTLCRKFVELHGGRIWVKSQLGAGSTFTFTIPVRHGE